MLYEVITLTLKKKRHIAIPLTRIEPVLFCKLDGVDNMTVTGIVRSKDKLNPLIRIRHPLREELVKHTQVRDAGMYVVS